MPLKSILLSFLFMASGYATYAQNEAEVLRYSSHYFYGTARFNGLGGAMGALGGDMSATHINPAGLGLFRFGTISFTPAIESNTIESFMDGNTYSETILKPVINNAGFVLAFEIDHPYWRTFNFGVSYNRLNTFNDQLKVTAQVPINASLMHDFAVQADGYAPENLSEFGTLLAYDAYVIDLDTINPGNNYYGRAPYGRPLTGDMVQSQIAERSGRLSETSLNFAANYNDMFYLGASINFQSVVYKSSIKTTETPTNQIDTDLLSYTFREDLTTDGLGVNMRLGGIVKVGKVIRFGASIQTPTTFTLTDNFQNQIVSRRRDPNETITVKSPLGIFEYRVRTPWRFMGSVAAVIAQKAIVSFQYEFSDFSSGKLKSSNEGAYSSDYSGVNALINNSFTARNIYRIGAEYRFAKSFYLRGGFAYFSNPNRANEFGEVNLNRMLYAGGLGFRQSTWNIGLSYQLAQVEEQYIINTSGPNGHLSDTYTNIALTVGFRI